jgi:hypothetical protein
MSCGVHGRVMKLLADPSSQEMMGNSKTKTKINSNKLSRK